VVLEQPVFAVKEVAAFEKRISPGIDGFAWAVVALAPPRAEGESRRFAAQEYHFWGKNCFLEEDQVWGVEVTPL
jgi:hypothetical protein